MTPESIRALSWQRVVRLGHPSNPHLPLIEPLIPQRSIQEIAERALALHICCAVGYGFPRESGQQWVATNGLQHALTDREHQQLLGQIDIPRHQLNADSLWALLWLMNKGEHLSETEVMANDTVYRLPNLKMNEPAEPWIAQCVSVRTRDEVWEALDAYYCIHWALRSFVPTKSQESICMHITIAQRRHALEWYWGNAPWDQVSLDT